MSENPQRCAFFGGAPPFPISRAVRAGDFVITCAMGDRVFTPEEALYDERGRVVSSGTRLQGLTFADEVHATSSGSRSRWRWPAARLTVVAHKPR